MPKLTKQIVDAAKPKAGKSYFIWCEVLTGFGMRVHSTGKKTYYVDYRNRDGGRPRMKIGDHGKLTTEEARKLALQILGGAAKGDDPAKDNLRQAATAEKAEHRLAGPRPHRSAYRAAPRAQARSRPQASRRSEIHSRRDRRQDGNRREDQATREGGRDRRRGHRD